MKFFVRKAFGQTVLNLMVLFILNEKAAGCPFLDSQKRQQKMIKSQRKLSTFSTRDGDGGIPDGGYATVKEDIVTLLTDSQDFFPADFEAPHGPNYGGLLIRLAWHCSGSYRSSDGRGGCDGGRIRFDPELNWPDNANLNNALKLLEPIKDKHGSKLSWGDLIILAGNTAIESMGGPVLGFCGGRIDDTDGGDSLILGPSDEQEAIAPCQSLSLSRQGECNLVEGSPIGPTTVGLIYVNPEGPKGAKGDPIASGIDIRRTFGLMGFNDTETVSLIGGGHAFGKCHGACLDPPCGRGTDMEGIGPNTFTSGFEGAWTTAPTTWTNEYFKNLFNFKWDLITGPGGNIQWAHNKSNGPDIMMLTTDIALSHDSEYKIISETYANNIEALNQEFMHSWYKLTTADMGPNTRCIGENLPPPQNFQNPLPGATAAKSTLPNFVPVRVKIQELLDEDNTNGPAFVNLAYGCTSTYRATDFKGGCNGARIRFLPESLWESNQGTADALEILSPVKEMYPKVSMADIIVLAGQAAIEDAGGNTMTFCGGRVDANDATGSEILAPRKYFPAVVSIRDDMQVKGLTAREGVALAGRPTTAGDFTNQFFIDLKAGNREFTEEELALLEDGFGEIVMEYSENEDVFKSEFKKAWTKMMVADRFEGPLENACSGVDTPTIEFDENYLETSAATNLVTRNFATFSLLMALSLSMMIVLL